MSLRLWNLFLSRQLQKRNRGDDIEWWETILSIKTVEAHRSVIFALWKIYSHTTPEATLTDLLWTITQDVKTLYPGMSDDIVQSYYDCLYENISRYRTASYCHVFRMGSNPEE